MSGSKNRKRKSTVTIEAATTVEEPDEELCWSDEEGSTVHGIFIPPPTRHQISDKSNRRLIIQKISNSFFKSYADAQVLGPFSKRFNAIVGPNGSGKSNVIDSMLFVFGYRATKIRCKKLSVLIHNTEQHRNIASCTVAVHFCEIIDKAGDDYEVVPGSHFVVARTASKDNSSFYELNGRRVQFKEIAKLLRSHGIDLDHNRFLILQGEVEEIATMKNKAANENETGMLEYLEDIVGTTRYKKPLIQINEEIQNLSVIRTEKLNRLALIQKGLEELKGPMEEAMDFLKTENKITCFKNFLYQKAIFDLEEQKREIETDQVQMLEGQEKLNGKLESINKEKAEKDSNLREASKKYEKLQARKEKSKEDFNKIEKADMELQAEMVQIIKNRKKCKNQLEEERQKWEKLQSVPATSKESIAEYSEKEEELSKKKVELENEKTKLLANIRAETKDLQAEKEKFETELGGLKTTVDSTKSAYDLAESELKLSQSQEASEKAKFESLKESVKTCKTTLQQRNEEVTKLKEKIPLTEQSLNKALKQLEVIRRDEVQINQEIKAKRMRCEENKASLQSSKSRGKILDSLMQQKHEGKCPGLYGRLGDLGAIDQKYDVAVSTACGPLDNIVVDTVQTAQWCIDFLKTHGIGRATFIPLEKQEYLRDLANSRIQTPENVHRLYDLIKVQDEMVKTAFYFSLRDTLVANEIDQATRIAYGDTRFRVVTIKGDLIEISGTMSGGGKSVSRGRMGQSVSASTINPQEIKKLEKDLETLESRLNDLIQSQKKVENQVNSLQPELNAMKTNLEKFTKELHSLREQLPIMEKQLEAQEEIVKASKSDAKQVVKLSKIVALKKSEYEKAAMVAGKIQTKVDQVTNEINEKTVGKMRFVDKSLSDVTKTIDKCKAEITRLRVACTTAERNSTKSAQKITTLETNITEADNKIKQMKEQRETIETKAKEYLQSIEEVTEQLLEEEGQYTTLKEEVNAMKASEKKLLLKKVDVDQTCKKIAEKLNNCNATMHQWTAKLSQLKLHDFIQTEDELVKYTLEQIQEKNPEHIELELAAAQNSIKNMKPNLNVIEEYKRSQAVYTTKAQELDEVTTKRSNMQDLYSRVKNQRRDEFMTGFNIIRLKLKEMYQMITLGGDADFEIIDPCDPFAEGVQFNVRPPKKSWKIISNLSGGEKTLSSLALVFALHYYKPSPLYVMDEIDAALDFKNVSIVGHYIKEKTQNAQFIIISLRSNMFELCDNLIGIYKIFNCTRTITIDPRAFNNNEEEKSSNQENVSPNVPETQTDFIESSQPMEID